MTVGDERELFLLLCRGLLETYCSEVTFDGSRFGVTSSHLPSRGTGARIVLDLSEAEFDQAIAVTEDSAASLWPDRPPRRRSIQLMLVHADEEIATSGRTASDYVLTLPDGFVSVRPAGPESPVDEAAALVEQQRIDHLIEEGRKQGHTFEWR